MRWLWLAVVLSACTQPSFRDCAIACTAVTGCPDGLSCGREGYCRVDEAAGSCRSLLPDAATPDAPPDALVLSRVTVTRAGSPNGRITSTPAGIDCPGTCSHDFPRGTTVVLAATPSAGATFGGWAGACSGTSSSCSLDTLGDRSVTGSFACQGSRSFVYTGASEALTFPACATEATFELRGAGGTRASSSSSPIGFGGAGGRLVARLALAPTDTFVVRVGGTGSATIAGFNGGGAGGTISSTQQGGGGGGASDVRRNGTTLAARVLVAGGGGGAANCGGAGYDGAPGGALTGGTPASCSSPSQLATGGTQTAGGLGGAYLTYCASSSGSFGEASSGCTGASGGGGGGGYYGGGGGAFHGGGGGSSFAISSATSVVHTQGYQTGNGLVIVTW